MTCFWNLVLIFSIMYTVHPGRHWVTAQSVTKPPVYQPDKELSVNIGDSATLRCCMLNNTFDAVAWFKQPNRKKTQIIVTSLKTSEETFHFFTGFKKSRFCIESSSNCFNMTILNTTQSDEAMYCCAVMGPKRVVGDGTYLSIKGRISTKTD
ncbi:uncharacterized protein LOC113646068 isoform X1 [Tachysurus ichikawai]